MGTRSLTHVYNDEGASAPFFTFYKQHDGYPDGWGKQLAEFLAPFRIVNGLSGDDGKIANGMGCLAAQIIAHFKDAPGQFYIYAADSKDCGEDYVYRVKRGPEGKIQVPGAKWDRECWGVVLVCEDSSGKELWSGPPDKFAEYLTAEAAKE